MSHAIASKRAKWLVPALLGTLSIVGQGVQAEDLMIPLDLPELATPTLNAAGAAMLGALLGVLLALRVAVSFQWVRTWSTSSTSGRVTRSRSAT